ncbi:MAG: DNA polymerase III subunit beta [Bacilli bacterium]|nr:DNA polymerase III subunit beta [Bacilli bacterium]
MKFLIDRDYLLNNLNYASRAISNKPQMPILTGIQIEAKTDAIILTTSNSDISIQVTLNNTELIRISNTGRVVLPGKYFVEIIKLCDAKEITITTFEDNIVKILANKSTFTLNELDKSIYPYIDFKDSNTFFYLDALNLKQIIKKTAFATSTSESKMVLTGVNLTTNVNKIEATATDSYRLAKKFIINDTEIPTTNSIIPSKSLDELNKIIDNVSAIVQIHISGTKILFKYENILFQSRLIDGTFPNTNSLIPVETIMNIKFNKFDLISAVERTSLFDSNDLSSMVKFSIDNNQSIIISSIVNEIGDAKEVVTPLESDKLVSFETGFSSKYFLDALKSFDSNEITIHFTGEIRPFYITGDYDVNHIQLILPVRA